MKALGTRVEKKNMCTSRHPVVHVNPAIRWKCFSVSCVSETLGMAMQCYITTLTLCTFNMHTRWGWTWICVGGNRLDTVLGLLNRILWTQWNLPLREISARVKYAYSAELAWTPELRSVFDKNELSASPSSSLDTVYVNTKTYRNIVLAAVIFSLYLLLHQGPQSLLH